MRSDLIEGLTEWLAMVAFFFDIVSMLYINNTMDPL